MNKQLSTIANIITLHLHEVKATGLIGGKMGMALFYYGLWKQTNIQTYNDIADSLLCEVLRSIGETKENGVEQGLTGIGWSINRLVDYGLLDMEPDALMDIEGSIFRGSDIDWDSEFSFLTPAVYLASKIENHDSIGNYNSYIESLLNACNYYFLTIYDKKEKPLSMINSILHFLLTLKHYNNYQKEISRILWRMLNYLSGWEWANDSSGDAVILSQLLQEIDEHLALKEQVLSQRGENIPIWEIKAYKRILWQQVLFMSPNRAWSTLNVDKLLDLAMNRKQENQDIVLPLGLYLIHQKLYNPIAS